MKRILYASAIVLAGASGATAATIEATEQNLLAIQNFVPEATMADLQAMTDTEIRVILNAISSGDSGSNKAATVRSLFEDSSAMDMDSMATSEFANETNLAKIQAYVPEATLADLQAMENEQIAGILNTISSGEDGGDKRSTVRALFEGDDSMMMNAEATSDFVNQTNLARIRTFAPEVTLADLARIGDEEVAVILNILSSDASEGDKRQRIQARFE
jgi:citrate lyase synthetase